jgi:hypothetical protein
MGDEKTEITVPDGYELVQDGLDIRFVERTNEVDRRSVKWCDKRNEVAGYYINDDSNIVAAVHGIRRKGNRNIFATVAQAEASIALAMLSQQVADCNGDWTPDWEENTTKWCIRRECHDGRDIFTVDFEYQHSHFLAFETEAIADEFLKINIDELRIAKDFV